MRFFGVGFGLIWLRERIREGRRCGVSERSKLVRACSTETTKL